MDNQFISTINKVFSDFILEIAASLDRKSFLEKVKKRLKLESIDDWEHIWNSLDLINNTETAKNNFFKYGLSGPTKIHDEGEHFLRLYGLLNAIYLQYSAILRLSNTFNFTQQTKWVETFKQLDIIKYRNILGAHTVDYFNHDSGEKNLSFQLGQEWLYYARHDIELQSSNHTYEKFNPQKAVVEFNDKAEDFFLEIFLKVIKSIFKQKGSNIRIKYLQKIESLKQQKEELKKNNLVIRVSSSDDEDLLIIFKPF